MAINLGIDQLGIDQLGMDQKTREIKYTLTFWIGTHRTDRVWTLAMEISPVFSLVSDWLARCFS